MWGSLLQLALHHLNLTLALYKASQLIQVMAENATGNVSPEDISYSSLDISAQKHYDSQLQKEQWPERLSVVFYLLFIFC